jgi:hypothetical protein
LKHCCADDAGNIQWQTVKDAKAKIGGNEKMGGIDWEFGNIGAT